MTKSNKSGWDKFLGLLLLIIGFIGVIVLYTSGTITALLISFLFLVAPWFFDTKDTNPWMLRIKHFSYPKYIGRLIATIILFVGMIGWYSYNLSIRISDQQQRRQQEIIHEQQRKERQAREDELEERKKNTPYARVNLIGNYEETLSGGNTATYIEFSVENAISVTINGEPISTRQGGVYKEKVDLPELENFFTIKASNEFWYDEKVVAIKRDKNQEEIEREEYVNSPFYQLSEYIKTEEHKIELMSICQSLVKQALVSPRSADFPRGIRSRRFITNDETIEASSYVDSKNIFGTEVRNDFTCIVKPSGILVESISDLELVDIVFK